MADYGNASIADLNTQLKLGNQNSSLIAAALQALVAAFPQVSSISGGAFTLAASASTTVSQTLVKANSIVLCFPTNAAAATLQGSNKSLYISARTANTSFVVSTASAASAAGTETFLYVIINL